MQTRPEKVTDEMITAIHDAAAAGNREQVLALAGILVGATGQPALLRLPQVAGRLSVSERSIWRLVASQQLAKPVRVGNGSCRWCPEDVDAYLDRLRAKRGAA